MPQAEPWQKSCEHPDELCLFFLFRLSIYTGNDSRKRCENLIAKTVSRFGRPTPSPSLTQNSSPSSIKPNSCPKIDGQQNEGTISTGYQKSHQEDIYGLTTSAKNRQMFTLTLRKWWLEKIRPYVPKPRNDTAHDGRRPFYLLPPCIVITMRFNLIIEISWAGVLMQRGSFWGIDYFLRGRKGEERELLLSQHNGNPRNWKIKWETSWTYKS